MASKPVILAVHGAWHTAVCFTLLIQKLKVAGYDTVAPTHLSCTSDVPPAPLQADSQQLRTIAMELADQGKEIIALVHSYGGVVATNSLSNLGIEQRKKEGLEGGVKAIVYMCAFIPIEGESLFGTYGFETGNKAVDSPWFTVKEPWLVTRTEDSVFYNDLPPEVAQHWVQRLTPFPVAALETPVEHEAWSDVPSAYIYCELDVAIPLAHQKYMVERVKKQGKAVFTFTLKASHSPFLSMPDEVVKAVQQVDDKY